MTRQSREEAKDSLDEEDHIGGGAGPFSCPLVSARVRSALERSSGATHPKMSATVRKVVDLWEAGEKVLVFAFYRRTCRALRIHISQEIERRMFAAAQRRLGEAGREADRQEIERLLEGIQKRFVDDPKSPGRKALDRALAGIIDGSRKALDAVGMSEDQRDLLTDVDAPLPSGDDDPGSVLSDRRTRGPRACRSGRKALDQPMHPEHRGGRSSTDSSTFWSNALRRNAGRILEAARRTQTGGIRVEDGEEDDLRIRP